MIRPSALNMPCGLSAKLAEDFPEASIAAQKGTDFHALMADVVNGKAQDARCLSILEHVRRECPGEARAEVRASLDDVEAGDVLTVGTADYVIVLEDDVTVIDWKTGQPTNVAPVAENYQVHAYALAIAQTTGAKRYRAGLYFTEDPPLRLGPWHSVDDWTWYEKIKARASLDKRVAVVGPHCEGCYSRKHCHAWTLPAHEGDSALTPFTTPGGLTKDNAAYALRVVKAMEDAAEVALGRLKSFARENGNIIDGDREWGPTTSRGRRSVSLSSIEENPEVYRAVQAAGLIKESQTSEVFRWKRTGKGKEK